VPEYPRLIADVMVGSLAKWLRMLGFDTLYFRHIDDNELIRVALQERRIVLTRDRDLAKGRGAGRSILIESENLPEQLRQVLRVLIAPESLLDVAMPDGGLPLTLVPSRPRCPRCNGALAEKPREAISGDVPEHVVRSHQTFFQCGPCGKVYWEGSHKRLIDKTIMSLLKELGITPDIA